ncbi:MAG: CDP-diacylglycerol--serine O-phosphatidyltransferase [Alphaproteobacteria bacterium]|nr:CDP-diacylglycerol--serine O-phosphatidyltransferase [Alphaproteobacteria bacterium]
MESPRRARLRLLPLIMLTPNILTVLALCAGLTAILFALSQDWTLAVVAILLAGVLDGLDGRLARLLKVAGKFGAELDSLADFVSFGVAPGIVAYLWSLNEFGRFGWIVALVYIVCCGLRLARFNTALEDPAKAALAAMFFTGVPAPAAAGLAVVPMIVTFQWDLAAFRHPALVGAHLLVIAFLMVSRIPTFAFKKIRVRRDLVLPMLLVVGVLATALAAMPWATLTVIGVAYVALIPFSIVSHKRMAQVMPPFAPAEPAPSGATTQIDHHQSTEAATQAGQRNHT